MRPDQTLFTYFHFAADERLTTAIIDSGITAIAYETLRDPRGGLPLLTPMSEVAGRMSIQEGAKYLERPQEGRGILLSGVPGVAPAEIAILGGGIVGSNAAKVAAGLGRHGPDPRHQPRPAAIPRRHHAAQRHDALLRPAHDPRVDRARRPGDRRRADHRRPGARLVRREDLGRMKNGAVIVDVAIDQGGCIETSRPTTHRHPTYVVDGVVHYCVTNMPGAVGRTSTYALCNVTLPYVLQLARLGWRSLAAADPGVAEGVNITRGASPTWPSPRPSGCRSTRSTTRRDRYPGTGPAPWPSPSRRAGLIDRSIDRAASRGSIRQATPPPDSSGGRKSPTFSLVFGGHPLHERRTTSTPAPRSERPPRSRP